MAEKERIEVLTDPLSGRVLGPLDAPPERTRIGKFFAMLEKLASAFGRSDGGGLPRL